MASLNKCAFIGNLGDTPELKKLPSGDSVTNASIAVNSKYKDKTSGEVKESTEWVKLDFFGKTAEIAAKYLTKGSSVYVEGRLSTRKYVDKDGAEKYATSIKVDSMQMLGGKASSSDGSSAVPSSVADDDIPF